MLKEIHEQPRSDASGTLRGRLQLEENGNANGLEIGLNDDAARHRSRSSA